MSTHRQIRADLRYGLVPDHTGLVPDQHRTRIEAPSALSRMPVASEIEALVATYQPTHILESVWRTIARPVREAALATAASLPATRKILPPLSEYAAWLHREGIPISQAALSERDLLERFIQIGMAGQRDSTRATRRAILRRVAARLDPDPAPPPEAIHYRRAKPPYTAAEVAGFFGLAQAQPTDSRRTSAHGFISLGLGCGLDRTDLAWVRGIDVTTGRCTRVRVVGGSRPRSVVALDEYAELIAKCAVSAGERLLIGGATLGRHNVTTPLLNRLVRDVSLPRLAPARLRSTWLVRHLTLGTPLSVLLPAAGLASSRTLDDLLEFADPIAADTASQLLRGQSA